MRLLAATAALAVLLAPAATAAPVYSCRQQDPAGDTAWRHLDVTSVELVVGKRELVVVVRLVSTDAGNDVATTAAGTEYRADATLNGVDFVFAYGRSALNGRERSSVTIGGVHVPSFAFTVVGNVLVWRVPRGAAPTLRKTAIGCRFTDVNATTLLGPLTADRAG